MEIAQLQKSAAFADLKDELQDGVSRLRMSLNPVREKAETIKQVKAPAFGEGIDFTALETLRQNLRAIWQYRETVNSPQPGAKIIDITDGGEEFNHRPTNLRSVDMRAYHNRVGEALHQLFESNDTLQKIKQGEPVSAHDLDALNALILLQNPDVDLNILKSFYEETAVSLDYIVRCLIGMDPEAVRQRFADFVHKHPQLTAKQTRFLSLLQNHIAKYGSIEIDRLYEPPFTTVDSNGLDGVFLVESEIDELIDILNTFSRPVAASSSVHTHE
jgi:type I restriction enzyme R subunit